MIKKNLRLLLMLVIAAVMITLGSCKKDNSFKLNTFEINEFIWYGMNDYYLWYKNVPKLDENLFDPQKNMLTVSSFNTLQKKYGDDHSSFFNSLLYKKETIDKWSWIVDDYIALENSFQGITLSMGFEYGLVRYGTNGIFGYVQYVVPGTPADDAGIKRGDIFISIDSQDLNLENYRSLLFGRTVYSISFANIVGNTLAPNGKTLSLTAVEVHENPIHHTEVIETGGRKVGYMVYNAFRSNYDVDLNTAFGNFRSAGIQDLILDFRYNGGGSVNTATYLSSMIYGTYTDKIFTITQYNDKLESYFRDQYGSDYFNTRFESSITQESGADIPINTLNLDRVYIITSSGSASASELVINGLDPYIEVFKVGEATHGKYVGSFTIKDYDSNGNINPNHTWALQPITLKLANSQGISDFVNGFAPDIQAEEDLANLLPFGDENEPMLKAALNAINGVPHTKALRMNQFEKFADSKDLRPHAKEMFVEGDLIQRTLKEKK